MKINNVRRKVAAANIICLCCPNFIRVTILGLLIYILMMLQEVKSIVFFRVVSLRNEKLFDGDFMTLFRKPKYEPAGLIFNDSCGNHTATDSFRHKG
jgi:hypothetical protein